MYPPKTQVAYIPTHAKGDVNHRDVEYGFVKSSNTEFVFCRFWRKGSDPSYPQLRTLANSEGVRPDDLIEHHFTDQALVEAAWKAYCSYPACEDK